MSPRCSGAIAAFVALASCRSEDDGKRFGHTAVLSEPVSGSAHADTDDRSWMKANPKDKLAGVVAPFGDGRHLHLTGSIAAFEGQSMIALVNVSRRDEPIVLTKWFEAGGGSGIGKLDVVVDIPETVKAGDCLAVKNVSGGRGFTEDETRIKAEFGAVLYAFTDPDGNHHPTGTTGPKAFRSAQRCLEDPAANRT